MLQKLLICIALVAAQVAGQAICSCDRDDHRHSGDHGHIHKSHETNSKSTTWCCDGCEISPTLASSATFSLVVCICDHGHDHHHCEHDSVLLLCIPQARDENQVDDSRKNFIWLSTEPVVGYCFKNSIAYVSTNPPLVTGGGATLRAQQGIWLL